MPTEEGRTEELPVFEDPGEPPSLVAASEVVAALFAELTGVPLASIADPGRTGIDGSIMLIKVTTEGLELLYRSEFGFSNSTESVSTLSAGT